MNPKISVIVPVYKVEKYLHKCVDSILAQTYTNLEVILVDDGSPDNCPAICDGYAEKDRRVRVIHKENGGVSSARNTGLDAVTGEYIMFVDSDDWISSDYCEFMLQTAKTTNADIVCSNCDEIWENDNVPKSKFKEIEKDNTNENLDQILCDYTCGEFYTFVVWAKLYSVRTIEHLRFDQDIHFGEDTKFAREALMQAPKVAFRSRRGYYYFRNDISATLANKTSTRPAIDHIEISISFVELCRKLYPKYINQAQQLYYHSIVGAFSTVASGDLIRQDRFDILQYIRHHARIAMHENPPVSIKVKAQMLLFYHCFPAGKLARKLYNLIRK